MKPNLNSKGTTILENVCRSEEKTTSMIKKSSLSRCRMCFQTCSKSPRDVAAVQLDKNSTSPVDRL